MDYGEVLKRAWQIIWKHKILWIFGILASCGQGGGGGGNAGRSFNTTGSGQGALPPNIQQFFENIPQWQIVALVIAVVVLILILVTLAIFLGTIGRIGLIRGAQQADRQEDTRLTFSELFRGSLPYFWRVFLLSLLIGLAIFAVVMVLIIIGAGFTAITFGIGALCLIPLICLLIPVAWVVSVVVEQASIAIVVENLGVIDGLRRGWEVVRSNPAPMIIMWLILAVGVAGIGGLLISLPIIIIVAPALIALALGNGGALQTSTLVIAGLCFVAYLPFAILLGGILQSYVGSAWTLTFIRLTRGPAPFVPVLPDLPLDPYVPSIPSDQDAVAESDRSESDGGVASTQDDESMREV